MPLCVYRDQVGRSSSSSSSGYTREATMYRPYVTAGSSSGNGKKDLHLDGWMKTALSTEEKGEAVKKRIGRHSGVG